MFIGDRILNMPSTIGDAVEIHQLLGLNCTIYDKFLFDNACKLAEMNNEIYDKHKNTTWLQEKINKINF